MKIRSIAAAMLLALAQTAQAGMLNFDNLSLADFDDIPVNYGDHGAHGAGDSRVGVTYSGSNGTTSHLDFWNSDYGDLSKVAFTPQDGTMARISFAANAGWLIQSLQFDLAGWPNLDRVAASITASIGGASASFATDVEGDFNGLRHSSYFLSTNPGGATAFIEWGNDWNIGIDNIEFTLIADPNFTGRAPEPTGLALFGVALAMLGLQRRRAGGMRA